MVVKSNKKVGVSKEPMFRMVKLCCERGRCTKISHQNEARFESLVVSSTRRNRLIGWRCVASSLMFTNAHRTIDSL